MPGNGPGTPYGVFFWPRPDLRPPCTPNQHGAGRKHRLPLLAFFPPPFPSPGLPFFLTYIQNESVPLLKPSDILLRSIDLALTLCKQFAQNKSFSREYIDSCTHTRCSCRGAYNTMSSPAIVVWKVPGQARGSSASHGRNLSRSDNARII